jgi:hypothetical protein
MKSKSLGWICFLFLAGLLVACGAKTATPVPVPTEVIGLVTQAKDIVGIWQQYGAVCPDTLGFLIFRTDGTYTASCNQDGSSGMSGTYWFENQHFLNKNDFCGTTAGQYEAQIVQGQDQSKSLIFTLIKDDCIDWKTLLTKQALTWVAALP